MKHRQYSAATGPILQQGIEYDKSGEMERAAICYETALNMDPEHPYALYLLGAVRFRQKDYSNAVRLISKAIENNSSELIFHLYLGHSLRASGNFSAAADSYDKVISQGTNAASEHLASAYFGKGQCLKSRDNYHEAIRCFRKAITANPQNIEAYLEIANLLRKLERPDEATGCLEDLARQFPHSVDAHINLGHAFLFQEKYDRALSAYRQAARLQPHSLPPLKAVGDTLLRLGRYKEARETYLQCFEISTRAETPGDNGHGTRDESAINVSAFYLEEVAGHIDYLIEKGIIDESDRRLADRLASLRSQLPAEAEPNQLLTLIGDDAATIRAINTRVFHYSDTPRISGPLINPQLDFGAIEREYHDSPTAVITIDQFLTPHALETLREFCLQSTIFFEQSASGFLSSYIHQGFNCSLLYEIAQELKEQFPAILDSKELRNMWIYRHPSQTGGVKTHTDQAAVTFNFWITPDSANLDPEHGGLIVYLKEQPADWDWHRFNYLKHDPATNKKIEDFLESAEKVTIPYRENRALLFHSNLFHRSDRIHFRHGYKSRRMNITMLFGDRDKHIGSGIRSASR